MSTTLTARPVSSVDIDTRLEAVDWASVSTHLDGYGWAMLRRLLTADECETIAGLYDDDGRLPQQEPECTEGALEARSIGNPLNRPRN